ncbi:MAG TPA: hypothetical protein VHC67_03145 [Gaiellaceae bacterium]|nr:hypothetical protein [Gaiellaceae bacterium]
MPLLDSPRARRRFRWIAALGIPVAAVVAVVLLVPSHGPPAGTPAGDEGPAQLASQGPKVQLTAADRRRIDAVLDRFLPAAMERKDEALGWSLAGPEMRASSSLAQWRKGNTPVPYYRARERTFHDWDPVDVGQGYVIFTLLVHPATGSKLAPYVFSGEVVKQHGSWLVNRLYTIAIMNKGTKKHPMAEVGPADFGAGGSPAARNSTPDTAGHKSRILVVLAVLALVALIPLTFAVVALRRARSWRRRVRSSDRRELPTLPARYRS